MLFLTFLILDITMPFSLIVVIPLLMVVIVVGIPAAVVYAIYKKARKKIKRCRRRKWAIQKIEEEKESAMIAYQLHKWCGTTSGLQKFERRLLKLGMISGRIPVSNVFSQRSHKTTLSRPSEPQGQGDI
jgi:Flp pilus assembly protein TadB